MKRSVQQTQTSSLLLQRNALAGLSSLLLISVVLQSSFLFFRSEKTILLPPESKQSYWIEGNRFSPSYLEEHALYMAHLLLDVSESNILYQGDILLRYVDPQTYGAFKTKLYEDAGRLKKDNLSLHFVPVESEVFPNSLSIEITGDLMGYMASKKVFSHRETYRVTFSQKKGRLFLKSFDVVKSDQPLEGTLQNERKA